jgi:hypothetical protein
MRHSEALDQIAPALVKAQGMIPQVHKDSTNPHFKSKFASLDAITEAALPALSSNGITLLQGGGAFQDDTGIEVVTRLLHESGQWIETGIRLPLAKSDPQGAGSAVTYGRRYGLAAILGIVADEDDDGNAASQAKPARTSTVPAPPTAKMVAEFDRIVADPRWTEKQADGLRNRAKKATTSLQFGQLINSAAETLSKLETAA